MQGVKIRTDRDIAMLRRVCSHVWVDTSRGESPDPRYLAFEAPKAGAASSAEFESLRKVTWSIESDLKAELKQAAEVNTELEASITEVMTDLQEGKQIDLDRLKDGVDAMIESILRNPSAFVWLREMKQRDR